MNRASAESRLAEVMLSYPPRWQFYGYPLHKTARVRPGRMYPALQRWLDAGYLSDGWDESDPPRRYYVLTEAGRRALEAP